MECCYSDDCEAYAVTPVLMAPCYPTKCSEDPPMCYPCLPRCPRGQIAYYCEKKPKTPPRTTDQNYLKSECNRCPNRRQRSSTPPRQHKRSSTPTRNSSNANSCQSPLNYCTACCQPTCKPVKTKYVIPCYRYEDGRIVSWILIYWKVHNTCFMLWNVS